MNQLSLSQAMQLLRSGRRLDPPPLPGRPRRSEADAGGDGVLEVDRISNLPDDLLLDILTCLGCAKEAARTSVLARRWTLQDGRASVLGRRWRGLWTQLPKLKFLDVPLVTVEGLLAQVSRPVLNLLHMIERLIRPEASFRVSSLLRAAQRLAPKNLAIVAAAGDGGDEVELPCFDRTTYLDLFLTEIILTPPPAGEFTALRSLRLETWDIELGSLLPMCPSLRYLHFTCYHDFDVVIVHPTLEELHVNAVHDDGIIGNMKIVTPLLKEARFDISRGKDFSMSFSAPMVEQINWHCVCVHKNVGLQNMRLRYLRYHLSHGVHTLWLEIRYQEYLEDADWSFEAVIEQLPFSQFSTRILELDVRTEGHAFGPLVLHLLQIRPVRKLEVTLNRAGQGSCPLDCPCDQHTNWRDESISLTELRVVKILGFKGEDDAADFLKVLFRCATVLKRMTVEVAAGGYNKICAICEQYPHVKCDPASHSTPSSPCSPRLPAPR